MFQATFWNNHETCTVVPTTEGKACGIRRFFSLGKISCTHIFCSSKIRIFIIGLVSNKNILSISIFNNVMRFEIYTISVHCTLIHCRSWTQCCHSSLPCVVGRIRRCKSTAVRGATLTVAQDRLHKEWLENIFINVMGFWCNFGEGTRLTALTVRKVKEISDVINSFYRNIVTGYWNLQVFYPSSGLTFLYLVHLITKLELVCASLYLYQQRQISDNSLGYGSIELKCAFSPIFYTSMRCHVYDGCQNC